MTIKLRFDKRSKYPTTPVWTEDAALAPVGEMLFSDFQTADEAREFAQLMREVVAGKKPRLQGAGNGYFHAIFPDRSEVGLNIGEDPKTVSVATVDLIAALEEWATHLEQRARAPRLSAPGAVSADELSAKTSGRLDSRIAQGWHLESSGVESARVVESTRSAPDRHGVYEASVEICDLRDGSWVQKDR